MQIYYVKKDKLTIHSFDRRQSDNTLIEIPKTEMEKFLSNEFNKIKLVDEVVEVYLDTALREEVEGSELIKKINEKANKAKKTLLGKYSEAEEMTFERQRTEAAAFLGGATEAQVPLIATLASKYGMDLKALADKISEKAVLYEGAIIEIATKANKERALALSELQAKYK